MRRGVHREGWRWTGRRRAGSAVRAWQSGSAYCPDADALTARLSDELVFAETAERRLRDDRSIPADRRDAALRNGRIQGGDPDRLCQRAWRSVLSAGAPLDSYRAALAQAESVVAAGKR